MSKVFELIVKYLGIPLAEKFGKWLLSEFNKWQSKRKIVSDQKKKTKAIKDAKTIEEIKAAARNNRL